MHWAARSYLIKLPVLIAIGTVPLAAAQHSMTQHRTQQASRYAKSPWPSWPQYVVATADLDVADQLNCWLAFFLHRCCQAVTPWHSELTTF
jgi:hypothetical protein